MGCLNTFIFLLITQLTGCISGEKIKCISLKSNALNASENVVDYACPREFDPKTYTECCKNGSCCEATFLSVAPGDDWLLMVTAILVIISCLILTTLVVICCFWSKCPLYNTCRANYTTSNIIVYSLSKDDPTPLMPAEGNKGGQYTPCTVKIKKMQEV